MWRVREHSLESSLVMGIVNVTPDSFSDGGDYLDPDAAIAHGRRLWGEGARILDVGGESTRPGANEVAADEELARVLPVVRSLAAEGALVSIDTSKATVAAAALEAGACIINDVTGLSDPDMVGVAASTGAGLIIMHMQGTPRTMQIDPRYDDVVRDVLAELLRRAEAAHAGGVDRDSIAIDPGIGFGKTIDHNLTLLSHIHEFVATGFPVVLGTSRKAFLGKITGRDVDQRDVATAATVALAVAAGVFVVRAHNVGAAEDARRVAEAIVRS